MTMYEQERNILSSLMRDHEDIVGSSRATMLALQSLITSVRELRCPQNQLRSEFAELADVIRQTRPKIIPLIHLMIEFEDEISEYLDGDLETVQEKAAAILQAKHDKLEDKINRIGQLGLTCIQDDDIIVLHTASPDVTNMIAMAKEEIGRKIKVIVLKQDFVKTKKLLTILEKAHVELEIIPEFSLSHYIEQASKLFVGALSITHDHQAISAAGTANIASLCHFHNIPVYMFANTLKISHGRSEAQRIHEKHVIQMEKDTNYILTTYSHDMVNLGLIDFLVTEDGIFPKESVVGYVAQVRNQHRH